MKYVWIKKNGSITIIDDIVTLYRDPEYQPDVDTLHILGDQVKLQVISKTVGTTYRGTNG